MSDKPVLGVVIGDASGVGPEIVAKLLANGFLTAHCRPLIIGDARVLQDALKRIGFNVPIQLVSAMGEANWESVPVLNTPNQDPAQVVLGQRSAMCGAACVQMLGVACALCRSGGIEGFVYAPLNKGAMREGGSPFESEAELMADLFALPPGSYGEINRLGGVMTVRVTSHIPLKEVSAALSEEAVLKNIQLAHDTAVSLGVPRPRIGVAALNPHGGEGGLCGREEVEVIDPAVERARRLGIEASGSHPADTLFISAFEGAHDAIVTMYHDQGQIALKLKDFSSSVTILGGFPYPIATCAHGTAHPIAGRGVANTSPLEHALLAVAQMARGGRNQRPPRS